MNELLFSIGKYTKYLCPKYNFLLISKVRPRHELKSAASTTHIERIIQITFLNNSSVIYFFKNVSRILLTLMSYNRGLWLQLFIFFDQKFGGRRFFRLDFNSKCEQNSGRNCRILEAAIM